MEKKINYLARSFNDIKSELIDFSKKYYPEISDSFNDASVGSWFIDLVSAVGDNLSYHADRMYQENDINSATSKKTILNNARLNGIHIPGPKSSMCEVELSCVLPINGNGNIAMPDFSIAPIVRMGSVVGNDKYQFELYEDVDFRSQFNSDGVSNRKFYPLRNNNGQVTGYTVTKSTIVIGGKNKIYKKVLTDEDVKPFMEVILPETNIMNVESVIFKENSNFNSDPQSYEYYIDEEKYKFIGQDISTYRFFEVDSLSDQFIFGDEFVSNVDIMNLNPDCEMHKSYDDYTESYKIKNSDGTNEKELTGQRTTRYFKGKWKPITQKFITEYTDNGYLKLIFGSGTNPTEFDWNKDDGKNYTNYAKYMMGKILNNDLLGVLPKSGWTMFVLYRTGGGIETNLAQGSINSVLNANLSFSKSSEKEQEITNSLKVINLTPSIGGKDFMSTDELKNYVKYAIQEQKRCVTIGDYKSRLMMIPPRYGCPFRCNVIEDNNKIVIPCLGLKGDGTLDDLLSETLKNNMVEYLKHYKTIGDYVEFKSGKIYNLSFEIYAFIDKNYTESDVVKSIIETTKEYMSINNHDMGEDIFIGTLEKEINMIDGVISLIDLKVFSRYEGNGYSDFPCPLPRKSDNMVCGSDGPISIPNDSSTESYKSFEIDLNAIESVLSNDYDSMYEILKPEEDIIVKTKTK